jgi:hypothetical protein
MHIPFASLLGLQAAIAPHVLKQPTCEPETASLNAINFVDPKPGGGSLLDHDSGSGLGEPLNVSILSAFPQGQEKKTEESKNEGYHFGPQFSMGPRRWRLRTLCKRNRIVSR